MPLKIVRAPNDPLNVEVVYLAPPDRQQPQRPLGNVRRDPITGRMYAAPRATADGRQLFVGLDLGQSNDFTAMIVVERTAGGLTVPFISRTRDLPYTNIVAVVADFMARPELTGARLVIDGTGVGRPVLDLMRNTGLDPLSVTITAGSRVTGGRRRLGVPKRDLVNAVLVAMQGGALAIAPDADCADALRSELADMRAKITAAGNDTYAAREGAHDDLVLALCLGVWAAERRR